jgi:hypothetical protein
VSITNIELIGDALRELTIISEIQTPSAEQGAHALRKLNQMMAKWIEDGVNMGTWFPQASTSDVCPIPDYAEEGVTCKLALALASNYGAAAVISPGLLDSADSGYSTILRTAVNAALPVGRMLNRPCGEGDDYPGNILTG